MRSKTASELARISIAASRVLIPTSPISWLSFRPSNAPVQARWANADVSPRQASHPQSPATGCWAVPSPPNLPAVACMRLFGGSRDGRAKEPWYHVDSCVTTQRKGGAHETHLARRPSHAFQDSRRHGQGRGSFSLPHLSPCNDRRGNQSSSADR